MSEDPIEVDMNDKHVMVMRYDPKAKFVLVSAKVKEQVGALADLTKILAIRGIDILEGHIYVSDAPEGYVTLFAASADSRMDANFVKQILQGSTYLESLTVIGGSRGAIIDSVNFPLIGGLNQRSILVTAATARDLMSRAKEKWGKEADEIIYEMGAEWGEAGWSGMISALGGDRESLQEYLQLFSAVGIGRAFVERFKPTGPSAVVSVQRLFECEGVRSDKPGSSFFRGIIAGCTSSLFGKKMTAMETSCLAMGDKECRFKATASE